MPKAAIISSIHNPRVRRAARLRDGRQRVKQGRIVIDGARELCRAMQAGISLIEAFVCRPLCHNDDSRRALESLQEAEVPIAEVTPAVFAKLAFGDRSEGIVGIALLPQPTLGDIELPSNALLAVLEGIEKPGNLGAVLRSADAGGVSGLIVADGHTDLYNPNAIRASLGTIFTVPVCEATSSNTLNWLRQHGLQIVAARVDARRRYTDIDFRPPTAVVLGSEAAGLSDVWQHSSVIPVHLPMHGQADSLNVSATAAVLFYEAVRQRQA